MSTPESEHSAEIELLRRQLARERRARATAEQVGERATTELYSTVQQLQAVQDELLEHAHEQELLNQLSRDLRSDLDTGEMLRRAVISVGRATEVDRCLIRLVDDGTIGPIVEQWSRPGVPRLDPDALLPAGLERLCVAAAHRHESIFIDDVGNDPRLEPSQAAATIDTLHARSYAGTPMHVGTQLVGWLVLHGETGPHPWTRRQRVLAEGIARDLGSGLLQAEAYRKKSEAVRHLEQVNRVTSEVVSTVSHELRTPLSSITGYLELLIEETLGDLTEQQHHVLDIIVRNAERLHGLMEDLLSLSRVDSGQAPAVHLRVDLRQVLAETRRALAPMLATRELDVDVVADEPVGSVLGDAEQLQRVFLNLLSNAIKFTPDGGRISLRLEAVPHAVVVAVEDTGYGIAESDLPHVFDRFFRTDTAAAHAIQGTGLGLAVVRAIVEEHAGTVEMTSAPGRGTTAVVTLPSVPDTPR